MSVRPFRRLAVLALLLPILAACGPKTNEFAPACPNPSFLRDLSDLIRYRPNSPGRDLTDVEVRARLTGLTGECQPGSVPGMLDTTLVVTMEVMRGPAQTGRSLFVPVFVAIIDGEEVVNKQVWQVEVTFPSNVDRLDIATQPIVLGLPVTRSKSGAAYGIIAGFQLSPEERENNRRRGF